MPEQVPNSEPQKIENSVNFVQHSLKPKISENDPEVIQAIENNNRVRERLKDTPGISEASQITTITRNTRLEDVFERNLNAEGEETDTPIQFSEIVRRAGKDTVRDLTGAIERHKGITDPLTDLLNRRGFDELIRQPEIPGFRKILVLADVDHLKTTNDTLGYAAGDNLLRDAAKGFSQEDKTNTARWGGDEFGRVFRDKTLEEVKTMYREEVVQDLKGKHVEMGIAVLELDTSNAANLAESFKLAHTILKEAKKQAKEKGLTTVLGPEDLADQLLLADNTELEAA